MDVDSTFGEPIFSDVSMLISNEDAMDVDP